MLNKLQSYNEATQKLMARAEKYNVPTDGAFTLPKMVQMLRESFKMQLTYYRVFNERRAPHWDPSTGFCLVASYYIYSHTGGDAVWQIYQTPLHWWLKHRQTGQVFDIAYTQFDQPFPYEMGIAETRLTPGSDLLRTVQQKAYILGKSAGLE